MPKVIRVRDVARNASYERGPEEPMLRVPYELLKPIGAVRRRGHLVDWLQGDVIRSGRVVPGVLGDVHTGERVLLKLEPAGTPSEGDEWWLCEIEAIDGVAGTR